ncbi:PQQ-binding-like beta-propeller repeat protein [Bacillus aerolatus]|uniref:PQQ-binding-like beta-propeller repeat protein n=1 Tax=Bacillus aerolatus TaxID=2653354 RepID=A0A6I1FI50_9BACI|nr:PQQ-binding-like beta-propeller repeat protein [Bacillus aerolatus]KAB7705903.1 PQQ-binding-like beta-propeller repeat protein [Bacillus aerolatus]
MKRNSLLLSLLLFLITGSVVQANQDMTSFGPTEWEQYRINTSNNAVFSNGNTRTTTQTYKTSDEVRANPVIVENSLYVGTHNTGDLYSFDVFSGKINWKAQVPNWIHTDAIYADDLVFVGYGNRKFANPYLQKIRGTGESGVAAFDAKTGRNVWRYRTRGEVMPAPAYQNGTIYIAAGNSKLYAIDAETGELQWDLSLPGWASMSSPHIKNGILYVGAREKLVAVDLEKQEIIWKQGKLGSVTDVPPAVSEGNIVVVSGAKMNLELNKKQLIEVYGENMPNLHFALTPAERKRYGGDAENYHFIYAFDSVSGKLLWKDLMGTGPDQKVPIPHTNTSGAVTIEGDVAYVGSPYTKSMMAYQISTGKKIWEVRTGTGIKGAPAVKDRLIYFGDTEGNLYTVQGKDGKTIHKQKLGGPLSPGGPVIINETLFIGSQDHHVYARQLSELQ